MKMINYYLVPLKGYIRKLPLFALLLVFFWSCQEQMDEPTDRSLVNRESLTNAPGLTSDDALGHGVNLQPSYYCSGDQDLGWDLMLQYPDIQSVRIEMDPGEQATVEDFARWIAEANNNGYDVVATYHNYQDNGSPDPATLTKAANWWVDNYSTLSSGGSFVINLMNEWGDHDVTVEEYANAYNEALGIVRQVYSGPVICDIPGWGQETHIAADASPLINDDNIIFSVHVYPAAWNSVTGSGLVESDLDYLESAGRPCMVGEFGSEGRGDTDWSAIVDHAKSLDWSVVGWAWNGDGSSPKQMNMASPYWGDDCSATDYTEDNYFWTVYDKLSTGGGNDGGDDTTAPASPSNLVATAASNGPCKAKIRVELSWDDNSESDLDGYNIYRDTQPDVTVGASTQLVSGVTSSDYTDSEVSRGTTYYYVVTAVDTSGNESGASNESGDTTCM